MSTEQSYNQVANGASAPLPPTLFDATQQMVAVTLPLKHILAEAELVLEMRQLLQTWFLAYIKYPGEALDDHDQTDHATAYETLDHFLAHILKLHLSNAQATTQP